MESYTHMKRNKSVKILGQEYKVKWTKKPLQDQFGKPLLGYCDPVKRLIVVHESGDKRDTEICYYHECVHGILFVSGLAQIISPDVQEIICENFAHFIYDLKK